MKLQIGEKQYPVDALDDVSLLDLIALDKEFKGEMSVEHMRDVLTSLQGRTETKKDELVASGIDEQEASDAAATFVFSNPEVLMAVGALVFLVRRRAGERLTLEEACDFPLRSLDFVIEPGDEVEEPDSSDPTSAA